MEKLIDLKYLSVDEKIMLMERLWNDLINNENYKSPQWHEDILEKRVKRLKDGKEKIYDWEKVKESLKDFYEN